MSKFIFFSNDVQVEKKRGRGGSLKLLKKKKKYYVITSKVAHFQPSNLLTSSYEAMKQRKCMSEESFQWVWRN